MNPTTQKCPMCAEEIPAKATACPFCGTRLVDETPAPPAPAPARTPVPPRPGPAQVAPPPPVRRKNQWIWWLVGGGIAGLCLCAALAVGGVLLYQSGLLFPASPLAEPTFSPPEEATVQPEPTAPTRTKTPVPTPTVNAPAQAFGDPILAAIEGRPPHITDDFSRDRGWYGFDGVTQSADMVLVHDGVIQAAGDTQRVFTHMVMTWPYDELDNYAVMVEAVFLASGGSARDREIGICWWPGDELGERFLLRESGVFEGGTCHDRECPAFIFGHMAPIPAGETVSLTLIHLRGESVVYVNGVPLAYHKLAITDYSSGFSLCPHTYDGKTSDIVYDNLKVWNLDLVPGLP
ncbi:MAG: hypothetical protein FD146_2361 [Anaerolineaceae bacterium]|nr:MAG: hypothetical protein FD146_2361 [Anaerolineaceae bacterium]